MAAPTIATTSPTACSKSGVRVPFGGGQARARARAASSGARPSCQVAACAPAGAGRLHGLGVPFRARTHPRLRRRRGCVLAASGVPIAPGMRASRDSAATPDAPGWRARVGPGGVAGSRALTPAPNGDRSITPAARNGLRWAEDCFPFSTSPLATRACRSAASAARRPGAAPLGLRAGLIQFQEAPLELHGVASLDRGRRQAQVLAHCPPAGQSRQRGLTL